MKTIDGFEVAFTAFLTQAQAIVDTHMTKHFPTLSRCVLTAEPGRRYVKIVRQDEGSESRSVYCFVDKTTGDILKAESWKKPAKGVRGNIFTTKNASEAVSPYGAHYAR